nr:MAG TPA: putative major coat protein [Inoviridae sp.]
MKFQNLKNKAKYALATVAVSAMSAPVMADGILDSVKEEISGYKTEIIALGAIIVGISIAFAVIRIGKRGANQV